LDKRETVRILRVPSSSKTFNTASSCSTLRQSHFLEQLLFELAASDPFLDYERLISGLFSDPDDFVFAEIVHGTTLPTASRALFPRRAKVRIISTYSEEEYMLNDTLELNIAAKLYNKSQTDVNNHSNKCSGQNLMDRIIEVYE
jgi:hypothetical protein